MDSPHAYFTWRSLGETILGKDAGGKKALFWGAAAATAPDLDVLAGEPS